MTATQSEFESMLRDAVAIYAAEYLRGITATDSIAALTAAAEGRVAGDLAQSIANQLSAVRAGYSSLLSPTSYQLYLGRILQEELRRIASGQSLTRALAPSGDLYLDFVANNRTVRRRSITRGTAAAGGSNVGNGPFYRLTVNYHNEPIEGDPYVLGYEAKVVADSTSRSAGSEVWTITSDESESVDFLSPAVGFDRVVTLETRSSLAATLLRNPSFDAEGAATNLLPGWVDSAGDPLTAATISRVEGDGTAGGTGTDSVAAIERSSTTLPLGYARFEAGAAYEVEQTRRFTESRPHVVGVWARKVGSPSGNLTIRIGGRSEVIAYSTLTTSWAFYPIAARDWWPIRWQRDGDGQGVVVGVSLDDPGSTNEIHLDSFTLVPMTPVNRTYFVALAGSTPWQRDDVVTWDDSETIRPQSIQHLIARTTGGQYLPSVADASTVTASGGRTLTFAASGDTITASSGDFASDGYEVGMTLTVAGTSNNNGEYSITGVTATVITVASGITDEGPLSATATLDATASIPDPVVS